MKNKTNLTGLYIMIGLIFLGMMLPRSVAEFRSYERTVDVKGLCEKEVAADKVIWPITFTVVGDNLSTVYRNIEENTSVIQDFLKKGGILEEEISLSVPNISDKFAQEYGINERPYRYLSTTTITICSHRVDPVRQLMSQQTELLKKGIILAENSWNNPVQFKYEGLNEIKPQMIEEATKNARQVGEKFAMDSGSRLGKIKKANQGTFTIEDRDSNTPYIKKVRVVTSVTYYLQN